MMGGWLALGWAAAAWAAGAAAAQTLLDNGGFEYGTQDWVLTGEPRLDRSERRTGTAALRLDRGQARQDLLGLKPGTRYTVQGAVKLRDVRPATQSGYAFVAVYQLDDFDELIDAKDFVQKAGTADWEEHHYAFTVAEGCRTVSVRAGLYQATGTVWLDDFTLAPGDEPVSLANVTARENARLAALGFRTGAAGSVAVLRDDIPASGAASSPAYLGQLLAAAGYNVAFLGAPELADPHWLNHASFDLVVLPYGASFPAAAAPSFRRFLRQGGKFFSTGGYAFDNLLVRTNLVPLEQGSAGTGPSTSWVSPAPARAELDHAVWQYDLPVERLRNRGRLTFSGFLKAANVTGPGMAYFAIYQTAADGSLPEWKDLCIVRGSSDWREYRYTFQVHPKAVRVEVRAGLYRCRGVACFDDLRVVDETGTVWLGAGFEDSFDPDSRGQDHWRRSDPKLCEVQERTAHTGRRALKVKLRFDAPTIERLNTRHGIPEDGLRVEPTQLGVFDADYRLERVRFAAGAPEQGVVAPDLRIEGELAGWAASGVVGFDEARWQPLVNGYDRYGRLRGAVGALWRHYAGAYAGSSWACWGVTNRDLFAESEPAMAPVFLDTVRTLTRDTYLAFLVPDQGCYRQGETVGLVAHLVNAGRASQAVRLELEIFACDPEDGLWRNPAPRSDRQTGGKASDERGGSGGEARGAARLVGRQPQPASGRALASAPLARLEETVTLEPGRTNSVRLTWNPGRFARDFYYVVGRLRVGDEEWDRLDSGFLVWTEATVAGGPPLRYEHNYLRFGRRPVFMFGTDDWGYVFNTTRETPLQWLRDMRQRRDAGVMIYENLQFGLPAPERREALWRKVDGVVMLAQRFGQVYMPGLLIGYNVAVSDAELEQQRLYCRDFAQRYRQAPGLIYYLNGDLRCELNPAVSPVWNDFLRSRYGASGPLRQAWGPSAATQDLGQLEAEDYQDWGWTWDI